MGAPDWTFISWCFCSSTYKKENSVFISHSRSGSKDKKSMFIPWTFNHNFYKLLISMLFKLILRIKLELPGIWYHLNNFLFLKVTYILHVLVNRLKIICKRRYNNEWLYNVSKSGCKFQGIYMLCLWFSADNRKKTRRTLAKQDFSVFNTQEANSVLISPQLALAAFRFLSTCKWKYFLASGIVTE